MVPPDFCSWELETSSAFLFPSSFLPISVSLCQASFWTPFHHASAGDPGSSSKNPQKCPHMRFHGVRRERTWHGVSEALHWLDFSFNLRAHRAWGQQSFLMGRQGAEHHRETVLRRVSASVSASWLGPEHRPRGFQQGIRVRVPTQTLPLDRF